MTPGLGRLAILVLSGSLLLPTTGAAQPHPSFSGELAFGTSIGNGGTYEYRHLTHMRAALSHRNLRDSSVSAFWEFFGSASMHSICKPTGACRGDYPETIGFGFIMGGLVQPRRSVELRLGIGVAAYGVMNPDGRVCAYAGWSECPQGDGSALGLAIQSDVAFFLSRRLGIVIGNQYLILPAYHVNVSDAQTTQTLWMVPLTLGLRLRKQ